MYSRRWTDEGVRPPTSGVRPPVFFVHLKMHSPTYLSEFRFSENFRFTLTHIKGDLIGGLTAAVVALPLALGFGILAYNGAPEGAVAGLYGAVFTGLLASFFGGTPQQITGPTGGMTVILTTVYIQHGGAEALLAACLLAGLFQIGFGLLKLGRYVHLVPYPVTVGFTNGIAALIFIQQIGTFTTAPVIALITIAVILIAPRINKNLPRSLMGLVVGTLVAVLFGETEIMRMAFDPAALQFQVASAVKTIGEIPAGFQLPAFPAIPIHTWQAVVPAAFTIALLGTIETLLASVVADNATDTRHNSNKELVGQGIGNFVAPFFGGVAGTGAIVRTMVNVRAGAKTRLSGIIHALVLALVIVALGPLAGAIPLAALAGVLMMTAVSMVEAEPLRLLPRTPRADAAVMIATTLITVFTDLITAVEVGMVMAAFLFVHRMSELGANLHVLDEIKGAALDDRTRALLREKRIAVFDVEGPLFFGAAKSFVTNLEKNFDIDTVILDMESVPVVDTTGAVALEQIVSRLHRDGRRLLVVGMRENVRRILYNLGVTQKIGIGSFLPSMDDAIAYAVALATDERTPRALGEYLHDACILLDVHASTRDELFDTCARAAEKAGAVHDRAAFVQSLHDREAQTPTVIGHGVAVPHARTGGVDGEVVLLFARLATPLRYTDDPATDVDFVFMVSAAGVEKDYLTVLRLIALNMRDDAIAARLRAATSAAEIHYTLSELRV